MNIVNVGYDSTNYYILKTHNGTLLVDCGWPGTLPGFLAVLKRKDAMVWGGRPAGFAMTTGKVFFIGK
jgi:hypothetical protein